jgi:hypothetical protein
MVKFVCAEQRENVCERVVFTRLLAEHVEGCEEIFISLHIVKQELIMGRIS